MARKVHEKIQISADTRQAIVAIQGLERAVHRSSQDIVRSVESTIGPHFRLQQTIQTVQSAVALVSQAFHAMRTAYSWIEGAAQEQSGIRQMERAFRAAGLEVESTSQAVESLAASLMDTTRYGDDITRRVAQTIAQTGRGAVDSAEELTRLTRLTFDVAEATQQSADAVAEQIARIYSGQMRGINQLLPAYREQLALMAQEEGVAAAGAEAIRLLEEAHSGAAASIGEMEQRAAESANRVSELKDSIGNLALSLVGGAEGLDAFLEGLQALTEWIERKGEETLRVTGGLVTLGAQLGRQAGTRPIWPQPEPGTTEWAGMPRSAEHVQAAEAAAAALATRDRETWIRGLRERFIDEDYQIGAWLDDPSRRGGGRGGGGAGRLTDALGRAHDALGEAVAASAALAGEVGLGKAKAGIAGIAGRAGAQQLAGRSAMSDALAAAMGGVGRGAEAGGEVVEAAKATEATWMQSWDRIGDYGSAVLYDLGAVATAAGERGGQGFARAFGASMQLLGTAAQAAILAGGAASVFGPLGAFFALAAATAAFAAALGAGGGGGGAGAGARPTEARDVVASARPTYGPTSSPTAVYVSIGQVWDGHETERRIGDVVTRAIRRGDVRLS